jgi:hypothetical protein
MATADTAKLIASLELQDKFTKPLGNAERAVGGLESRVSKLGSHASRGVSNLATNIAKIGVVAGGVAVAGLAASVSAASDLNEEIDKSQVVFGDASDEMLKFADGAAAIGLSKAEALGAAGAFGNMFNTIGFAQDESQDMSETMVQLAADMASFNNEEPSEMLDRLRSGLSGEAEPLRRFGILISEATVKAFAYENGIAEVGETLTEAQKVQARYGLILQDSAIQQGNFADTSSSLANQQRVLKSNLSNTAATIGQTLLPSVSKLLGAVNELFIDKQPQIAAFGEKIGTALAGFLTDENIDKGIGSMSAFIDKLATSDVSGAFANVGGAMSQLGGLPWAAIGDAAKLLGTGSKALLDAFLGLPPWVQTAVLTGWGLNKLTGGALGGIVGELGKGLIKGVLNMNAGVVNVNGKVVTGGPGGAPVPGGKGGGGLLGTAVKWVIGPAAAAALGVEIGNTLNESTIAPAREFETDKFTAVLESGDADRIENGLTAIDTQLDVVGSGLLNDLPTQIGLALDIGGVRTDLEQQRADLLAELIDIKNASVEGKSDSERLVGIATGLPTKLDSVVGATQGLSGSVGNVATATNNLGPRIDRVANTPHNVTANVDTFVNVNANIGVSVLGQQAYRTRTIYNRSSESTNTAGY